MDAGTGFVVPDDSRLSFDILIPADSVSGARMGFMVVVELTQRPTRRTKAVGKIVEILGDKMGTSMAVDIALRTHEIPHTWPPQVEKQVADLSEQVPEAAKKGRVDLRKLPLVTIDGEDARDFDDAVYCEKNVAAAGACGSRSPTSVTTCARAPRWTMKRAAAATRCTSRRR